MTKSKTKSRSYLPYIITAGLGTAGILYQINKKYNNEQYAQKSNLERRKQELYSQAYQLENTIHFLENMIKSYEDDLKNEKNIIMINMVNDTIYRTKVNVVFNKERLNIINKEIEKIEKKLKIEHSFGFKKRRSKKRSKRRSKRRSKSRN